MTVQWPDRDDITDWTPGADDTANSRTLQSGSKLMAGCALTDGINLVWSDTSLYVFQYTGSEFVYDDRLAGSNCGLAAPLGFTKVSGVAFWISGQDFYMYAGGVQAILVFRDMDTGQITGDEIEDFRVEGRQFSCTIRSHALGGIIGGIQALEIQPSGERR